MRCSRATIVLASMLVMFLAAPAAAQDAAVSSGVGPSMQHMGPIAFGPDAVLFAADAEAVQVYALDLATQVGGAAPGATSIPAIDEQIAATLGTGADNLLVTDMAVHPGTRNVFISVMRGRGAGAQPVLLRVDGAGDMTVVSLDQVPYSRVRLPDPPGEQTGMLLKGRERGPDSQLSQQPGDRISPEPVRGADDYRSRLCGRSPLRGRTVERGVRVEAALDCVSVQQRRPGHECRDLARAARSVRDAVAHIHVRAV